MRRYWVAIFSVVLLASCGGSNPQNGGEAAPADSVVVESDTTALEITEEALANLPVPKAADELFDDFIYNFAANRKLQMERIMFPLKKVNGDRQETIEKNQWKIERYFMRQQYYTLLFDSEKHMEVR